MKILFICGSLSIGKDGVGDYTRQLAAKLISLKNEVFLISIYDKDVSNVIEEIQGEISQIPVLRIPNKVTWKDKIEILEKFTDKFDPDWISFQFVHYSYHEKGLPIEMTWKLNKLFKNRKLHIMIHECWVGGTKISSPRHKVIRFVQQKLVKLMLNRWKPSAITTSIPVYQRMLRSQNIDSTLLPIFSNIKNIHSEFDDHLESIPDWLKSNRKKYLIGGNFGSFYKSSWNLESFFTAFSDECRRVGKKPLIYSIGNLSSGTESWSQLERQFPDIRFLTLGRCGEKVVSYWFSHFTDFGIVTTPYILAGKSGSYMAYKQHGISCFCDQQTLQFDFSTDDLELDDGLIPMSDETNFLIPPKKNPGDQVTETADLFIQILMKN